MEKEMEKEKNFIKKIVLNLKVNILMIRNGMGNYMNMIYMMI